MANLMVLVSVVCLSLSLVLMNSTAEWGAMVKKADATTIITPLITYYPFYSLSVLTLMLSLIPTCLYMGILNIV
jgi:ABC-type dipeptide/oligopeptide/nickel transport system permease subunit